MENKVDFVYFVIFGANNIYEYVAGISVVVAAWEDRFLRWKRT